MTKSYDSSSVHAIRLQVHLVGTQATGSLFKSKISVRVAHPDDRDIQSQSDACSNGACKRRDKVGAGIDEGDCGSLQIAEPRREQAFLRGKLQGFTDAPDECLSAKEMYDFVSQVAPVRYPDNFPYRKELQEAEKVSGIPIEEVQITIKDGTGKPKPVTKRYGAAYDFESGTVRLSDCAIHYSPTKKWWAWVEKKADGEARIQIRG